MSSIDRDVSGGVETHSVGSDACASSKGIGPRPGVKVARGHSSNEAAAVRTTLSNRTQRSRRSRCNCFEFDDQTAAGHGKCHRMHLCDRCGRKFAYCKNFKKHMEALHSGKERERVIKPSITCAHCGRVYVCYKRYMKHVDAHYYNNVQSAEGGGLEARNDSHAVTGVCADGCPDDRGNDVHFVNSLYTCGAAMLNSHGPGDGGVSLADPAIDANPFGADSSDYDSSSIIYVMSDSSDSSDTDDSDIIDTNNNGQPAVDFCPIPFHRVPYL